MCTILNDTLGLDVLVLQGDNNSVDELFKKIEQQNINVKDDCECFLLSMPSYYSLSWCVEFCSVVKQRYNKKVIVGGRWVVDGNVDWIKSKLPHVDVVIEGFGEKKLAQLLCPQKAHLVDDGEKQTFKHLNYKLLVDYHLYQPSIEISRGCGSGCAFCADRNNARLPNKPVDVVIDELRSLQNTYGDFSAYFEAPHFVFNPQWCNEFVNKARQLGKITPWRCTTRVESVPLDMIAQLAQSGLKIIDVGLESASPTQLVKMNKTRDPQKYLDKAVKILQECYKHNVWVKLNVLLFAGETYETVNETISWLNKYKKYIKGVAVSSLVYYKNAGGLAELIAQGAKAPDKALLEDNGFVNLDLSDEISASKAQEIALQISRIVATSRDYFDIKSVSYFERGYTYDQFVKDVEKCPLDKLPFVLVK